MIHSKDLVDFPQNFTILPFHQSTAKKAFEINDLCIAFFSFLSESDLLCTCSLVNKQFRSFTASDALWKTKLIQAEIPLAKAGENRQLYLSSYKVRIDFLNQALNCLFESKRCSQIEKGEFQQLFFKICNTLMNAKPLRELRARKIVNQLSEESPDEFFVKISSLIGIAMALNSSKEKEADKLLDTANTLVERRRSRNHIPNKIISMLVRAKALKFPEEACNLAFTIQHDTNLCLHSVVHIVEINHEFATKMKLFETVCNGLEKWESGSTRSLMTDRKKSVLYTRLAKIKASTNFDEAWQLTEKIRDRVQQLHAQIEICQKLDASKRLDPYYQQIFENIMRYMERHNSLAILQNGNNLLSNLARARSLTNCNHAIEILSNITDSSIKFIAYIKIYPQVKETEKDKTFDGIYNTCKYLVNTHQMENLGLIFVRFAASVGRVEEAREVASLIRTPYVRVQAFLAVGAKCQDPKKAEEDFREVLSITNNTHNWKINDRISIYLNLFQTYVGGAGSR